MTPLFSFSITDLEAVKNEILAFQEEYRALQAEKVDDTEADVVKTFAKLLMTPVEQFQQFLGDVTSRLRFLTIKPKEVTKTVLSPLEQSPHLLKYMLQRALLPKAFRQELHTQKVQLLQIMG